MAARVVLSRHAVDLIAGDLSWWWDERRKTAPEGAEPTDVAAGDLIAALPGGDHDTVLRYLLGNHLSASVTAVDCLLDECDARTFAIVEQMTSAVYAGIEAQARGETALRELAARAIGNRFGVLLEEGSRP